MLISPLSTPPIILIENVEKNLVFPELGEHQCTTDPEQSLGADTWFSTPNSISLHRLWKMLVFNSPPDFQVWGLQ